MFNKSFVVISVHDNCVLLICLLSLLYPKSITAETAPQRKPRIDSIVFQTAGYLGYIAMGVGKDFGRHKLDVLLGYMPREKGGVELWQLNAKYAWHPFKGLPQSYHNNHLQFDPLYLGVSVIYGEHSNLFGDEPEQYPDGYYPPTALRYTLNIGTSLQYERYTLFLEYAALDSGLIAYVKNPKFFMDNYDYFGLKGIGSLALGLRLDFD